MSRVSVVIPSYNRAHIVGQAIRSALEQTLPPDEVIVVDDKSSDDSRELLTSLAEKESRLRPVFQEVNQGPAGARNRGVAEARGDYVAFLDSDDLWAPNHLKSCVAFLDANPELDLVFGDLCRLCHDGRVLHPAFLWEHKKIGQYLVPDPSHAGWFLFKVPEAQALLQQYVVPVQTAVVRRETALAFPFDRAIFGPEDYDCMMRMARAGKRFGFVNRVHCDCFIHESNLMSNGRSAIRESVETRKVWVKVLGDPALTPSERTLVRDHIAQLYFDEAYAHRGDGNLPAAVRAHLRSLRARFTWRGVRGLIGTLGAGLRPGRPAVAAQ
jgi:glycosyltransferase involved in cell wall biosynthesis